MNKKKHIMTMIGIIIIVAGGMFYGGMRYGNSKVAKAKSQLGQRDGNGSRATAGGVAGAGGQRGLRGGDQDGQNGNGFSSGQILSKDDTSITIKTRDGGSKIVYYSGSTIIGKAVSGTSADLSVEQDVMVNGNTSPDGSIVADNIQIRPAGFIGQNPDQN